MILKCEHKYFHLVAGKLLCVQCGDPPEKPKAQTKAPTRGNRK